MVLHRDESSRIQVEQRLPSKLHWYRYRSIPNFGGDGPTLARKKLGFLPKKVFQKWVCCAVRRVTTEDPEKGFTPDYGKILSYRSSAGFGVRLDGAMGDTVQLLPHFTILYW